MKSKVLISAILLSIALPATADWTIVEQAYEVHLKELRLPRNETGTIAFKTCKSCDYITKRVNSTTEYKLNGKPLSLAKLRGAVSDVANRSETSVTVLHHLKMDQVTAVSISVQGNHHD